MCLLELIALRTAASAGGDTKRIKTFISSSGNTKHDQTNQRQHFSMSYESEVEKKSRIVSIQHKTINSN